MHWLPSFELVIFLLSSVAAAFVVLRLARFGLHRRYRFLTAFLLLTAVSPVFALSIGFLHPSWYYGEYFTVEGLSIALMLLVVLEVFTLILRGLPGIARLTAVYIRLAVILCVLAATALLFIVIRPHGPWRTFQIFKQTVYCSALFFVLLITAFLRWYPVSVNRNTVVYATGFAIYFSCETAFLLLLNTKHRQERTVSQTLMVVSCACLLYWGLRLTPEGEVLPSVPVAANQLDEAAVLRGIRALNSGLSGQSPQE